MDAVPTVDVRKGLARPKAKRIEEPCGERETPRGDGGRPDYYTGRAAGRRATPHLEYLPQEQEHVAGAAAQRPGVDKRAQVRAAVFHLQEEGPDARSLAAAAGHTAPLRSAAGARGGSGGGGDGGAAGGASGELWGGRRGGGATLFPAEVATCRHDGEYTRSVVEAVL